VIHIGIAYTMDLLALWRKGKLATLFGLD